jgi:nicotinate-nucleotide--dimethylbenzimidazole phosphoribosyltransferase
MGIGNTTASSALLAALTGISPADTTGRGTGVDDAGLRRKVDAISRALEINQPDPADVIDVLAKVGGFEIAGLAGAALACAANRIPVVIDGFISSVAALVATRINPRVAGSLIASHRSVEVGHHIVLEHLNLKPLFDLEMRLGEGTGAALAMGLIDASLKILHEMATFDSAGVSDRE